MLKIKCDDTSRNTNACDSLIFATLIDLDLIRYEAREIRIHTPSDHTVKG